MLSEPMSMIVWGLWATKRRLQVKCPPLLNQHCLRVERKPLKPISITLASSEPAPN